jgi:hypothetical protein
VFVTRGLGSKRPQAGISPLAPPMLAHRLPRLPRFCIDKELLVDLPFPFTFYRGLGLRKLLKLIKPKFDQFSYRLNFNLQLTISFKELIFEILVKKIR